jgi:hypothetical protein
MFHRCVPVQFPQRCAFFRQVQRDQADPIIMSPWEASTSRQGTAAGVIRLRAASGSALQAGGSVGSVGISYGRVLAPETGAGIEGAPAVAGEADTG